MAAGNTLHRRFLGWGKCFPPPDSSDSTLETKKAGLNPTFRFHLSCASTSVVTIPSEFPIRIWV